MSPCKQKKLQISLQVDLCDGMLRDSTEQNSYASGQAKVNMHCYSPCMCSFTDFHALVAFFKFNLYVNSNCVFSKLSYPTNRHGCGMDVDGLNDEVAQKPDRSSAVSKAHSKSDDQKAAAKATLRGNAASTLALHLPESAVYGQNTVNNTLDEFDGMA